MSNTVKKRMIGLVVSDKMDKTVVVRLDRITKHSVYKKYMKKSRKVKAHDEGNICKTGDSVKIIEICRPLSRDKRWKVLEVLSADQASSAGEVL